MPGRKRPASDDAGACVAPPQERTTTVRRSSARINIKICGHKLTDGHKTQSRQETGRHIASVLVACRHMSDSTACSDAYEPRSNTDELKPTSTTSLGTWSQWNDKALLLLLLQGYLYYERIWMLALICIFFFALKVMSMQGALGET
eukprot:1157728-Pelagomonas_calceolata.AAC.1